MNIVLVGFMGTGKTTTGKALAKKLNMKFLDIDEEIEREAKMKISEIFEEFGEPHFRELEKNKVKKLASKDGLVISAGGGVILFEENVRELKKNGVLICLRSTPEKIYERIKKESHRPLLDVPNPKERIRELLERREPFYAQAAYSLDTTQLTVAQSAEKIIELLRKENKV